MPLSFESKAKKAIPADVHLISATSSRRETLSADGEPPSSGGKRGGEYTAALLHTLKQIDTSDRLSWSDVLYTTKQTLNDGDQCPPQLSSSRMLKVKSPFHIVPPTFTEGKKRAVLIGINYVGQKCELTGCHDSVKQVKNYLITKQGFAANNITILCDDNLHHSPTRANILSSLRSLVNSCKAGDVAFVHFAGHSGRLSNKKGSKGYNETMIPVDFASAGHVRDEDLYKTLVCPMTAGVTLTCFIDCCHGGSIVDLPYRYVADSKRDDMYQDGAFAFDMLVGAVMLGVVVGGVATAAGGNYNNETETAEATTALVSNVVAPDDSADICCSCEDCFECCGDCFTACGDCCMEFWGGLFSGE